VTESLADHEFAEALASIDAEGSTELEKVEMLVEIAMRLQHKPRSVDQLRQAVELYDAALARAAASEPLLEARIRARKATALSAIPDSGAEHLPLARSELERALPVLLERGSAEEGAEAELNLGLVTQSLAALGRAKITDAISAYQRAIRVFSRDRHATEYAILHNNLATAYLSIPMSDERGRMREALAVQSFEEALNVVTLVDNPTEYAMLQNNLGNALQYAASGHPLDNNLRALRAYDAALKVRTARDTPVEYANTLANKANCLRNLPDDAERPRAGNRGRLAESATLYREARAIYLRFGALAQAELVGEALTDVERELAPARTAVAEPDFGEPRI